MRAAELEPIGASFYIDTPSCAYEDISMALGVSPDLRDLLGYLTDCVSHCPHAYGRDPLTEKTLRPYVHNDLSWHVSAPRDGWVVALGEDDDSTSIAAGYTRPKPNVDELALGQASQSVKPSRDGESPTMRTGRTFARTRIFDQAVKDTKYDQV